MNANSRWNTQLLIKHPARLNDFHVVNRTGASVYVQIFDTTEIPRDGETPLRVWECLALSTLDHDLPNGRETMRGLLVIVSTSLSTLTKLTTEDALIDVNYDDLRK